MCWPGNAATRTQVLARAQRAAGESLFFLAILVYDGQKPKYRAMYHKTNAPRTMCAECGTSSAYGPAGRGKLVSALCVLPQAPTRFTCPLAGCLMLEPVTLINSGRVCYPT